MKKNRFFRLFSFMGKKPLAQYIIGLSIISVLGGIIQILLAYYFKNIYDAILASDTGLLIKNFTHFGLVVVVLFSINPIFMYMARAAIAVTSGNIRKRLFHHIQKLPLDTIKSGHSGDLISRLTNDIAETEKAYQIFLQFVIQIVIGLFTMTYLFYLEWRLGLLSLVGAFITLIVNVYFSKQLKKVSKEVQERLAGATEKLSDLLAGMNVIRSFNIRELILGKFLNKNKSVYDKSYQRVKIRSLITGLNTMAGASFFGIIAIGSLMAIKGHMEFGVILAAVQLQNGPTQLVRALGQFIPELQSSLAAADRVYEVLDKEEEPENYQIQQLPSKEDRYIAFNQVVFAYQDGEPVLENLTFKVSPGKTVALAGPSGGGKSTIFKLFLNFFPPDNGDIIINGKSISKQTIEEIRAKIAYVPQDAYLFAGTIAENIRYGQPGASLEEIKEAARIANADYFIENLEKGYETMVGERGTHLSGGQRQRIAIARAVLKDAEILLLDEATSALDTESEQLVQDALNKLMIGRTTLVIAHRLSTIVEADKIFILKDGQIVEEGTHQQLLKLSGTYQKLYQEEFQDTPKAVAS